MNVFDLNARLGLNKDDYENGLKSAGEAIKKFGSAAKTIAKVSAAGFSAVATGVSAIAKQAVQSYADYEQLVGGVETLFGAGGRSVEEYAESMGKSVEEVQDKYNALMQSQEAVMAHASEAYKNAGLSANDYMETVTGFSASLLQSLGGDTVKAAEYADRAIVDMADNANKMGTSMEAIQNAYSGFAKANYTMLDNLKLGYGGTGEEMKRLIQDAAGMTKEMNDLGVSVDATDMSFGNIVNAISVMQKHLDIAGTTQKEAASTISGSLSMMQGAWQNLITGVADDTQDFDSLIGNFVDSVDIVAGNIMPRVEQALGGVGKLIEKLVPQVMDRLPDILSKTLPSILKSAGALTKSFGKAISDNADTLLSYVRDTLYNVLDKLSDTSVVADGIKELIMNVVIRGRQILDAAEQIGVELVRIIAETLGNSESSSELLHWFMIMINDLADNTMILLPTLLELGFNIVKMIGQGIVDNVPWMLEEAVFFLGEFAAYLADNAPIMASRLAELVANIAEMLTDPEAIGSFIDVAISLITTLADSLIAVLPILLESAPVIIENLAQAVTENFPKLLDLAWNLIKTLTNAILVNLPLIIESGEKIIDSIGVGITTMLIQLDAKAGEVVDTIKLRINEAIDSAKAWGKDLIDNFIGGIKEKWENLKETVSNVAQSVKDFLGFSEPKKGPLSNFHTYAPDMMELYAQGIKDNTKKITAQLESSLSDVKGAFDAEGSQSNSTGLYSGGNVFNITITSGTISSDYDARRAAQIMSEELSNLKSMQNMAVGA